MAELGGYCFCAKTYPNRDSLFVSFVSTIYLHDEHAHEERTYYDSVHSI